MERKIVKVSGQHEFIKLMQANFSMTAGQAGAFYNALLHADKLLVGDTWIILERKAKVA